MLQALIRKSLCVGYYDYGVLKKRVGRREIVRLKTTTKLSVSTESSCANNGRKKIFEEDRYR